MSDGHSEFLPYFSAEMRSRYDLRRQARIFSLANDAARGEPLREILIRLNSMIEWIFGSDRPAFPQVHNETVAELGMVVAAEAG
jgi:hypothetical protein